ncbi:TolC family protein [Flavobacteriaceae bacterium R38]|nr:TolC family protein [Flavobacteriaceae bacterium R38]
MKQFVFILFAFVFIVPVKGQQLEGYLNEALKNNPRLQSLQYKYESAVEKVSEAGSLPNTTFETGYFIQETETRVGPQRLRVSAKQKFPWFGTLDAKKKSAAAFAESELQNIELIGRKLVLDVKKQYYHLYENKAGLHILERNLEILKTDEKLALTELENDRSTLVDVLKIRIKINDIENQITSYAQELETKKKTFNILLNRDSSVNVTVQDSITLEENVFTREQLINNPRLIQLETIKDGLLKSEIAAQKEGLPAIGVGLDYILVDELSFVNPIDNGKDIIIPSVSVSVPLFSKKYSSKRKQYQLQQEAVENDKTQIKNELESLFEKSVTKMKNADRLRQTKAQNIQQAQQAEKVLLTTYQAGKLDFDQILEVQQLILKFQLEEYAAIREYLEAKAMLEYLTIPIGNKK